jgi:hypothetical protein
VAKTSAFQITFMFNISFNPQNNQQNSKIIFGIPFEKKVYESNKIQMIEPL